MKRMIVLMFVGFVCAAGIAFALPVGPLARRSVVSGGDNIVGTMLVPTSLPTHLDIPSIIQKAKQINPIDGAAFEGAVGAGGSVNIVEFDPNPDAFSGHDWNTIAIARGASIHVQAVAALHEYRHVTHCTPPPPGVTTGPETGDDRITDPCYKCTHAQETADSFTELQSYFCELDNPGSTAAIAAACQAMKELKNAANSQRSKCPNTCTGFGGFTSLAAWNSPCPNCP